MAKRWIIILLLLVSGCAASSDSPTPRQIDFLRETYNIFWMERGGNA